MSSEDAKSIRLQRIPDTLTMLFTESRLLMNKATIAATPVVVHVVDCSSEDEDELDFSPRGPDLAKSETSETARVAQES